MAVLLSPLSVLFLLYTAAFVEALTISKPSAHHQSRKPRSFYKPFSGTRDGLFAISNPESEEACSPAEEVSVLSNRSFRKRVKRFTKKMVPWSQTENNKEQNLALTMGDNIPIKEIVDEAFAPAEESLRELEDSLIAARAALENAKIQTYRAIEAVGTTSSAAEMNMIASNVIATNGDSAEENADDLSNDDSELESMTFEDVDYESSEMAPPFLDQDSCLMPDAEPLVRVEKAPDNSRRIFAGIDILASADDVWNVRLRYPYFVNRMIDSANGVFIRF